MTTATVELPTDPDAVELEQPFALRASPGVWVVAQWKLTPKLSTNGCWFPHFWCGPGSRTWMGTDGDIPVDAARFASLEEAATALTAEDVV